MIWTGFQPMLRFRFARHLMGLTALLLLTPLAQAALAIEEDYMMMPVSDRIVAVTLTQSGDTAADLLQGASHRAVMATIGRIYFEDSILIATDILQNYVANQFQKFIISTKVLNETYIEGRPRSKVKVFVDIKKLRDDLNEKRFIVRPRLEPYFDVYLGELIEGNPAPSPIGHTTIVDILRDEPNVRVNDTGANNTPTNLDIMQSPTIFRSGLINAQKSGVEAIITGLAQTTLQRSEELYFTTYYFYQTQVSLRLIRVDTAEVLFTATSENLASATSTQEAASLSVRLAVTAAMDEILKEYQRNWQVMMGHESDYVFMFTGVSKQQLITLIDTLSGLDANARAYLKNTWENTAVVTLEYKGGLSRVQQFIEANPYPVLHLIQAEGNRYELRVD